MNRTNWYVQSRGNIVGPMAIEEIRRITDDPKVDQQLLIIRDGWKGWLPLPEFRKFVKTSEVESTPLTSATVAAPKSTPKTGDWFLSINGRQIGPLSDAEVESAIVSQADRSRLYVIHRSWNGWKHVREIGPSPVSTKNRSDSSLEQRAVAPIRNLTQTSKAEMTVERRQRPFRSSLSGTVLIHNDQALVSAVAANISESGIFVKCDQRAFVIGELLKLTVKCPAIGQAFQAIGKLVRYDDGAGMNGTGFAIQITEVGLSARQSITRFLVEQKLSLMGVAS